MIAIHYFGFPNRSFPAERVTSRGGILVEDASQALFLPQQFPESACILYSPAQISGRAGLGDHGIRERDRN